MSASFRVPAYGIADDEPVTVTFEHCGEATVFIKLNGLVVGGLDFDRNDRGVVAVTLNTNDPDDGEWYKANPIYFEEN